MFRRLKSDDTAIDGWLPLRLVAHAYRVVRVDEGGQRVRFAYQDRSRCDWDAALGLSDALLQGWPSPGVALNRAVVLSVTVGLACPLREVERLETNPRLVGYRYLSAIKADLLIRMGRDAVASDVRQKP